MHALTAHWADGIRRNKSWYVGGLVAGILILGLVAAPMALAKANPSLSLKAMSKSGEWRMVTGQLLKPDGKPIVNLYVYFQHFQNGKWQDIAKKRTSQTGRVYFNAHPVMTTKYRLFFGGTRVQELAHSPVLEIKVAMTRGALAVARAAIHRGKSYVWASAGPYTFDCSGLTKAVYGSFGVKLPHLADAQKRYGVGISQGQKRPGDLMIFVNGSGYGYHAAIYAGGGLMWEAGGTAGGVGLSAIWSSGYVVRRLL